MAEYASRAALRLADLDPDPIAEFGRWFEHARSAGLLEPTAAALSTADSAGRPSGRMVLLKGFGPRGFVFYTNYESRKSRELEANPWASLHLWWDRLEQQIRIEGAVARVSAAESDEYFSNRPRPSQLGVWASAQSRPLASRADLERSLEEVEERFAGGEVSRPSHWGGFRITPARIEFWQGRRSRLHDRIHYVREAGAWRIERLAP